MQTSGAENNQHTQEINLGQILSALWKGRGITAMTVLLCLMLTVAYLHLATYRHTATLVLTPAQSSTGNGSSRLGALSGLASVAGINLSSGQSMTPFELYIESVASTEVVYTLSNDPAIMQTVFKSEWDKNKQQWRNPVPTRKAIINAIKRIIGAPAYDWNAPDAVRLKQYIDESIAVAQNSKKPIITLTYNHEDPAFAVYLLNALNKAIDNSLREQTIHSTQEYIKFLSEKLGTTSIAEHREDLAQALSDQEKMLIFAQSDAPFAANPLDAASASPRATSPNAVLSLIASVFLGLMLGALITLVRHALKERQSPQGPVRLE